MDSRYAFSVVHTFGKIWKERALINTQGKGLIHEGLIMQIFEALKGPKRIAVVHVKGHQRGRDIRVRGNNLADEEAKRAALGKRDTEIMSLQETEIQQETLSLSLVELAAIRKLGAAFKEGKWILPDSRIMMPKPVAHQILDNLHRRTHWGTRALCDHFLKFYGCIGIFEIGKQITQGCLTCQRVNKKVLRSPSLEDTKEPTGLLKRSRLILQNCLKWASGNIC